MRLLIITLLIVAIAQPQTNFMPARSSSSEATNSASNPYMKRFKKKTFSKGAAIKVGAGATFAEFRNVPEEWGRGPGGFGKRLASGFARNIIKNGIEVGVGSALHEQLNYQPSQKQGFSPR